MDQANYALQLIAEGKLNISSNGSSSLQLEKIKIKNFRNNVIISILSVVIVSLLVF